jgi:hypothetical protein
MNTLKRWVRHYEEETERNLETKNSGFFQHGTRPISRLNDAAKEIGLPDGRVPTLTY